MKRLKIVDVRNDYVAVMRSYIDSGLMTEEKMVECDHEGIVVGVGPEAREIINVGDNVIVNHRKYVTVAPAGGGYSGADILIVKSSDILVRVHLNDNKYTFVNWKNWNKDDEKQDDEEQDA